MNRTLSALRSSLTIDTTLLAPVVGAITAIPVVGVFAVALSLHNVTAAIAMAVGANLVAVVALVGAPKISLSLAALDALTMGVSSFVGTATGTATWLHVAVLVPWCFAAGMLVVFGQTQAAIGTQAIIAFVVLGRFHGSLAVAAHLSAYVMAGAFVEVAALVVLRLPPSLRFQRGRLANAMDAIAELALLEPSRSAINTLGVVDEAERALGSPALFGRTDVRDLRAVLDQARRVRLELTTLAGLRGRLEELAARSEVAALNACVQCAAHLLTLVGNDLRRGVDESEWTRALEDFRTELAALRDAFTRHDDAQIIARQCVTHLVAIGGQLRSAHSLVTESRLVDGRHVWRPRLPALRAPDVGRLAYDLDLLRSNLHRRSAAYRHAIRLAAAVPASVLLASWFSLPRGYWLPFAVAVILKPDYSTLLSRGVGRIMGTALGATLAALVVSTLQPSLALSAVLVGACAWVAYSTWSANFAVAIGFITALVLVLLTTSLADPARTALDRLIEVCLGGAVAVTAYLVWPTPSRAGVTEAQSRLFGALAQYLKSVLALVGARAVDTGLVVRRSRDSRVAFATAEAAVGRSVLEPSSTRIAPNEGRSLLAAAMRILRAAHALRIDAERGATVSDCEELEQLGGACVASLEGLGEHFAGATHEEPTALRDLYLTLEPRLLQRGAAPSIGLHLDELVNAINTAALLAHPSPAAERA
ncbi:MAG TPA: FUSC family protein [Acidimicrobiales bacterium]|nr:FUSC family protein [Acidimicrobiales bacterium]